jgi:ABC-type dipeptide/oligopeptide/nickel transport system permease subunit
MTQTTHTATALSLRHTRNLWTDAARRFARNRLSMAALVLVLFLLILAALAPWLAPTHYDEQVYSETWQFPSGRHLMGTDPLGRDVLSRIIYGARISLTVAVVVNLAAFLIGAPIGAAAGWFGGGVDYILMRLVDVLSAIPSLLLAILLMTILGSGLRNVFLVLSFTSWIGIARQIRGQVLTLRERDFVLAARAIGGNDLHIILRHLLPNALAPVIVALTLGIPAAIMGEASLSFLGVGVNAPMPSWGKMVNEYLPYIQSNWYLSTFPAIMIAFSMYAFTLMGDGLQEALNPSAKR